jgi:predicted nucleic acid-binding Zn ribbon protein
MPKREREEHRLGDLLGNFIKNSRLEKGLDEVSVREAWYKVMGEAISKYTREVKLRREVLYVDLSSSVLREELSYGRSKIITMMNEEIGKELIKKLVLR